MQNDYTGAIIFQSNSLHKYSCLLHKIINLRYNFDWLVDPLDNN